jgi:hypothetical protein
MSESKTEHYLRVVGSEQKQVQYPTDCWLLLGCVPVARGRRYILEAFYADELRRALEPIGMYVYRHRYTKEIMTRG